MPKTSKFLRTASSAPEIAKTKIPAMSSACWTEDVNSSLSTGQLCRYYPFGLSSGVPGDAAPSPAAFLSAALLWAPLSSAAFS